MSQQCSSSSSTSSSSYSSDDSTNLNLVHQSSLEAESYISWHPNENKLDNFSDTLSQFHNQEVTFVLKARCRSNNCACVLKNHDWFFARSFMNCKLLVAKYCKLRFSKSTIPDTDCIGKFILFRQFPEWLEIMNENLEVIPYWINTSQIIQNKPKMFILRKDTKCLVIKEYFEDSSCFFEYMTLKSGTILTFINCKKYSVRKTRNKVKELNLIKCDCNENSINDSYYFTPDETIYISPIAGQENISGCHTISNIIDKFHFPINVKSVFLNPPLPNIPSSERHFYNLSDRFQLDLIFLMPFNESKRLFVITPGLFEDHYFTIGEFCTPLLNNLQHFSTNIQQQIALFLKKIDEFSIKCHKYECLSYLLKYATNTSKVSSKFETNNNEFDDIYVEVDDIYFYIRNGYFPRKSVKLKSKPSISSNKGDKTIKDNPVTETTELKDAEVVQTKDPSSESNDSEEEEEEMESDEEEEVDDEDDNSSTISTTSSESHVTSSTALALNRTQQAKSAKSMPLSKKRPLLKSNSFAQSNFNVDLSKDDMLKYSIMTVSIPEDNEKAVDSDDISQSIQLTDKYQQGDDPPTDKIQREDKILKFYQSDSEIQRLNILNLENISLKYSAV